MVNEDSEKGFFYKELPDVAKAIGVEFKANSAVKVCS
jgi:hypothetical protein